MSEELSKYLRESEERYRTLVEAASDAILSVDENNNIIFANTAVEKIFGYKVYELIGKNLSVLLPENKLDKHLQKLIQTAQTNNKNSSSQRIEIQARRHDGSVFDLEISFADSRQNGKPCSIGIGRDISERKRAQEDLRESQMMLTLAMRSSRIGAWELDLMTDAVKWSGELEELVGFKQGEFKQTIGDFYQLVAENDREKVRLDVQKAIEEKREYEIEFRFYHKDGSIRWMEGRGQAIYSETGAPIKVYGIGMDITERKKAESISDRYRLLSKGARDIILFVRTDGEIVDVNQAAIDTYGYDYRTLLQMNLRDLRAPETIGLLEQQLECANRNGIHFETQHQRKDGSTFPVEVNSIGADVGGERLLMSIIRDISERKMAEIERENLLEREQAARAEAEAANRAKDEFLSVLSHELRTPLNAILGWTMILQSGSLDQPHMNQAIETIERNARLQNNLIEDLLDVSRIISGKMRIDPDKIDLTLIAKSAVETIRPIADSKNISLTLESEELPLEINGDATRLQQVIVNLANNAVKFTPENGAIKVILSKKVNFARLEIIDTGIGIKPDFLPLIFDRFRQADSTTKRNHSGLGLGLTIVRHLTEMHDGNVYAKSDGEGKGASFAIEIPLIDVQKQEIGRFDEKAFSETNDLNPDFLRGKAILLIDDDCDGIYPVKLFLEKYGAEIVCVESAADALKKFEEAVFDLIISDIGMPEVDGYQLIEKIRTAEHNSSIPAIALTAYASAEDRQKAVNAGFQTHFSKPINYEQLLQTIIKIIADNENK